MPSGRGSPSVGVLHACTPLPGTTRVAFAAEIAIPIVELTGDKPSTGRTWAANATRVVPGKGVQAWSTPTDGEPRPEGMGLLQFRAER